MAGLRTRPFTDAFMDFKMGVHLGDDQDYGVGGRPRCHIAYGATRPAPAGHHSERDPHSGAVGGSGIYSQDFRGHCNKNHHAGASVDLWFVQVEPR